MLQTWTSMTACFSTSWAASNALMKTNTRDMVSWLGLHVFVVFCLMCCINLDDGHGVSFHLCFEERSAMPALNDPLHKCRCVQKLY